MRVRSRRYSRYRVRDVTVAIVFGTLQWLSRSGRYSRCRVRDATVAILRDICRVSLVAAGREDRADLPCIARGARDPVTDLVDVTDVANVSPPLDSGGRNGAGVSWRAGPCSRDVKMEARVGPTRSLPRRR